MPIKRCRTTKPRDPARTASRHGRVADCRRRSTVGNGGPIPTSERHRPGHRPRELDLAALEAGLLADLPAHSPGHVLVRLELAAEAVVVTEVNVVRSRVPADHQYPLPILGQQ